MLAALALSLALTSTPTLCAASQKTRNAWERVRFESVREYCDLLAKGEARLAGGAVGASEALVLADKALVRLPHDGAAVSLRGRALAALHRDAEALNLLDAEAASLDDARAAWLLARLYGRAARHVDSARVYAQIAARGADFPVKDRAIALFEYGLLRMAEGPARAADARTLLQEASRLGGALSLVVELAQSLLASRLNEPALAFSMSAEEALRDPIVQASLDASGAPGERDALVAFAKDAATAHAGRADWQRYLTGNGGKGPWAAHARARAGAP